MEVTANAEVVDGHLYVFRGTLSRDNSERLAFYILPTPSNCMIGRTRLPIPAVGDKVPVTFRNFRGFADWPAQLRGGSDFIILAKACQ